MRNQIDMSIHLCNTLTILNMIEHALGDEVCEDASMVNAGMGLATEREKDFAKIIIEVYKIVHSFNESHSCHGVHENWREEAYKYAKP